MRMRRLSHQIYATIIVALLATVVVASFAWRRAGERLPIRQAFEVAGELAGYAMAPPSAPRAEQEEAVRRLATRLDLDLALFDAERRQIAASTERPLPAPPRDDDDGGFVHGRGGPGWAVAMPDGRWLVARAPRRAPPRPALGILGFLTAIALLVGLAAYPVVRGLTGRLERLQSGVEKLGLGDLKARVPVEGRDEVARLAASFNGAAHRIEELVGAHRMLLANASHELRTPLARVRLGVELIAADPTPARRAALEADIAELDQLIDEILLSSRLEAGTALQGTEDVDLLALAAEEAARFAEVDVLVEGRSVLVAGEARLLRRLVRNLIENALKHGTPPVRIVVATEGLSARFSITDAGPGIPLDARPHVFEPFRRASSSKGPGSGLGLALVRQIARRHGGEARLGAGAAEIVVTLPLRAAASRA